MNTILAELNVFLTKYEKVTNSHDFNNVRPLIAVNAIYWFSDGTHVGLDNIEKAFNDTFNKIQQEVYTISSVDWVNYTNTTATCLYNFHWKGKVDGEITEGTGRGTNVLIKENNNWLMLHEHLSTV